MNITSWIPIVIIRVFRVISMKVMHAMHVILPEMPEELSIMIFPDSRLPVLI
jgi:hypothetical protein